MSHEGVAVPVASNRDAPRCDDARSSDGAYARVGKRAVDVAGAVTLLVLVAPLLLLLMLAIVTTSPGPAIYRSRRVGLDGRSFAMFKLRTMTGSPCPAGAATSDRWRELVADGRQRVTPLGRILRALSLDELPQLVNVVRGDMSLVGPRPELVELVERWDPEQARERHRVRPGLTGPWQVSAHRNGPIVDHVDLDLSYVEDVRFGRDLSLLVVTIPAMLGLGGGRRGA